MGNLTQKKPYHQRARKTQKKEIGKRITQKGGGWFGVPGSKVTVKGASSSLVPFTKAGVTRRTLRRPFGVTTWVDEAGQIRTTGRTLRGKKAALAFWRGRTTEELVQYKQHKWERLKGMQKVVDDEAARLKEKVVQQAMENKKKLVEAREQLSKVPIDQIKPDKLKQELQDSLSKLHPASNASWGTNNCDTVGRDTDPCKRIMDEILTHRKNIYAEQYKDAERKITEQLKPLRDELTKKRDQYLKMERKVNAAISKKIISTDQAILKAGRKKCSELSSKTKGNISSSKCISDFVVAQSSGKGLKTQEIVARMPQTYRDQGFSLSEKDVFNANKGIIFQSASRRKAVRATKDTFTKIAEIDSQRDKFLQTRYQELQANTPTTVSVVQDLFKIDPLSSPSP